MPDKIYLYSKIIIKTYIFLFGSVQYQLKVEKQQMPSIKVNIQGYLYDFQLSNQETIRGLIKHIIQNELVVKGTPRQFVKVIPENGLQYEQRTKISDLIKQHIKVLFVRCVNVQGLQLDKEYFYNDPAHLQAMKNDAQMNLKTRQNQIWKLNQQMQKMNALHKITVHQYYLVKQKNTQLQTKLKKMEDNDKKQMVTVKPYLSNNNQMERLIREVQMGKKNQDRLLRQNQLLQSKVKDLQQKIRSSRIQAPGSGYNSNIAEKNSGNSYKIQEVPNRLKQNSEIQKQKVQLKQETYKVEDLQGIHVKKPEVKSQIYGSKIKVGAQQKIGDVNPSIRSNKQSNPGLKRVVSNGGLANDSKYGERDLHLSKEESGISSDSNQVGASSSSQYNPHTSQIKLSQSQSSQVIIQHKSSISSSSSGSHNQFYRDKLIADQTKQNAHERQRQKLKLKIKEQENKKNMVYQHNHKGYKK